MLILLWTLGGLLPEISCKVQNFSIITFLMPFPFSYSARIIGNLLYLNLTNTILSVFSSCFFWLTWHHICPPPFFTPKLIVCIHPHSSSSHCVIHHLLRSSACLHSVPSKCQCACHRSAFDSSAWNVLSPEIQWPVLS